MIPSVILCGASTRAAAHSALRAGWQPICFDMFGDVDVSEVASVTRITRCEDVVAELERLSNHIPVVYTGGFEGAPQVLAELARQRPVFGNIGRALELARTPTFWTRVLASAGLPILPVRPNWSRPVADGTWLRKPLQGGGGRGIVVWTERERERWANVFNSSIYFQRYADRPPVAALDVAAVQHTPSKPFDPSSLSALFVRHGSTTRLLGLSWQLIGLECGTGSAEQGGEPTAPWSRQFEWCGNIAPAIVTEAQRAIITRVGETLGDACGLTGIFGGDFVLEHETPHLVELNPRYTGSAELFDYLQGESLFAQHLAAFGATANTDRAPPTIPPGHVCGKRIVYAHRAGLIQSHNISRLSLAQVMARNLPDLADIPSHNTHIESGEPLCTLFATAPTAETCFDELAQSAQPTAHQLII